MADVLFSMALSLVHLFIGLISAVLSVFLALRLLNKMTGTLDEWKELKSGNIAIGILFVAVIISVLLMIAPVAASSINLIQHFRPAISFFTNFVIAIANIFIASIFSIFALYLSFFIADKLTFDINELGELKKGNVAVALMIAAIFVGIAFVITPFIIEFVSAIDLASFAR